MEWLPLSAYYAVLIRLVCCQLQIAGPFQLYMVAVGKEGRNGYKVLSHNGGFCNSCVTKRVLHLSEHHSINVSKSYLGSQRLQEMKDERNKTFFMFFVML
jgi:hypothetical protein